MVSLSVDMRLRLTGPPPRQPREKRRYASLSAEESGVISMPIHVITMPILAIKASTPAITMRRSARSRCADPRDHDAATFAVTMARYAHVSDYQDPFPGYRGYWEAAVFPVGYTGYFVMVERRRLPGTERSEQLSFKIVITAIGLALLASMFLRLPVVATTLAADD
jgi:hypothetical protein